MLLPVRPGSGLVMWYLTPTAALDAEREAIPQADVQTALDRVKETNPAIVNELVPDVLPAATVQRVLANLLRAV